MGSFRHLLREIVMTEDEDMQKRYLLRVKDWYNQKMALLSKDVPLNDTQGSLEMIGAQQQMNEDEIEYLRNFE
jgi:hypothetical protein